MFGYIGRGPHLVLVQKGDMSVPLCIFAGAWDIPKSGVHARRPGHKFIFLVLVAQAMVA